ncbi:MAG: calcium-binding protein [Asticcacaulis sp.]
MDTVMASVTYHIFAFVENLTLTGTADINATGNNLANILIGNSGNNVLNGQIGADILQGGAGNDGYIVDNSGDIVIENANEGTDKVLSSVSYALTANVENLTLTGAGNINRHRQQPQQRHRRQYRQQHPDRRRRPRYPDRRGGRGYLQVLLEQRRRHHQGLPRRGKRQDRRQRLSRPGDRRHPSGRGRRHDRPGRRQCDHGAEHRGHRRQFPQPYRVVKVRTRAGRQGP